MKYQRTLVVALVLITMIALWGGEVLAAELKIAITQATAGDARKYQPLIEYFNSKGIKASFITAPDYSAAADMFSKGSVDAMFCGSGIAGTMIIKEIAMPVARPVGLDGTSTYTAVVIAPKGSTRFEGKPDYFNGKTVIFSPLASAGEFYFHSVGSSKPKEIKKAPSHAAALDALSRGQADVAVIKNHVWTKEKSKYPQLEQVGEDKGQNPDGTLIVSKLMKPDDVFKISSTLLALEADSAALSKTVKDSMQIKGFIKTTPDDFKSTIGMLKKAGVTKTFNFKF